MDKGTDVTLSWKWKGLYSFILSPQDIAFFFFGNKMGIKFDTDLLVVDLNNHATKIVNAYIVYELGARSRNTLSNFKLKNCLFGATNMVKSSNNENWVYNGYAIAFDGASSWNFGEFARNYNFWCWW